MYLPIVVNDIEYQLNVSPYCREWHWIPTKCISLSSWRTLNTN